jgi:hypothetical protein
MSDHGGDGFSEPALHGRPVPWMQELRPPSRRHFVLGTVAAGALAAMAGVVTGWLTSNGRGSAADAFVAHVPAQLPAAVGAERELLATVEAALHGARGASKAALRAIRADHRRHLAALQAAIGADSFPAAAPTGAVPSGSASALPSGQSASVADVRTAEQRASKAAAARALLVSGRDAGLLASIAASEACHVELLQ